MQLSKEQLRELYKERDEALFFDFKPITRKYNVIKWNKVILDKEPEVFNHYITLRFLGKFASSHHKGVYEKIKAYNNLGKEKWNCKQVVIKTLSNLNRLGAKNALSYVIRNSNTDFALNQDGELQSLTQIMSDWSRDFTHKKNAKEVLHLAFCIDEKLDEYGRIENILKNAVSEVMQKNFYLYKYAIVIHSHQNKPHAHILINKNNRIDGQKFHLSNAEFKPFFNQLRNDFAKSLNAQGLHYHNHYKLENDLSKLKNEINQNAFISKQNVLDELTQLQLSVDKKIKAKYKKINALKEDLKNHKARQDEVRKNLGRLKTQIQSSNDMGVFNKEFNKAFFQNLNDLKTINEAIKEKYSYLKLINKDLNILEKDYNKFSYQKLILRHDENQEFSTLIQKKKYLDFITSNIDRKTLTKSEINLKIKAIQQDIILSQSNANEMLKENIKASLLTSSLLGKDNNAFALIRAFKELEKNVFMLKECKKFIQDDVWADDETRQTKIFDKYEQRLQSNQSVILDLINQRFLLLQKEIEHRKKNLKLKAYHIKEYEKASAFLNKNNARELESLYRLIGEGGETKSQNANLSKNDNALTSKSGDLSKNVSSMSEGKENTSSTNNSNDLPKNDTSLTQKATQKEQSQIQNGKELKSQETTQQTQQNSNESISNQSLNNGTSSTKQENKDLSNNSKATQKTQTLQDKMKSSGFVVRR